MAGILGADPPAGILGPRQPTPGILGMLANLARGISNPAGLGMAAAPAVQAQAQGMGDLAMQANQAMPWGGNDPTAIGIDPQMGTIDPSVMVPFASNVAGTVAAGGIASPKPAGALGIFGGKLAKTADHAALAKAEKMAADGVDRGVIWNETGWFQGGDKKWRFEIPDNATTWPVPPKDWVSRNSEGTLMAPTVGNAFKKAAENLVPEAPVRMKRLLGHEDLAAAYPKIPETEVLLERNRGGQRGSHNGEVMGLNEAMPPAMAKSTMLHEAQHVVQGAEGFAAGGNTSSLWNHSDPAVRKAVHSEWERLLTPISREEFEKGFSNGWSPSKAEVDQAYADYLKSNKKSRLDVYDMSNKAAQETAAMNVYQRLAGETEARNVQTRQNMTPEQRQASPPWLTQDVPDIDQIIRMSVSGAPNYITGGRF